eukprot:CAMPEP_0119465496 /NCGR_PEP_ID=MMETSP1344-20130328/600_1 /TAXON_ID=236787 /ORGANISM="Florenciella parvula, Strain CCMP2471" /LENGTH=32 /DNA_ID= /DNA_START= /DNA_END= /DNA_ORIENTATION=
MNMTTTITPTNPRQADLTFVVGLVMLSALNSI